MNQCKLCNGTRRVERTDSEYMRDGNYWQDCPNCVTSYGELLAVCRNLLSRCEEWVETAPRKDFKGSGMLAEMKQARAAIAKAQP